MICLIEKLPSAALRKTRSQLPTDKGLHYSWGRCRKTRAGSSRVVKKGSFAGILRVFTKRGGDDEKTAGVSVQIR
jgi:hypothetical protein